jgi:ABC-2 type transport system permease protein
LLGEEPDYPAGPVEITRFKTPAEAQTALEQGHIQAYYDLPPDYWETGQVIATYETAPTNDIDNMVTSWIEDKVQAAVPNDILTRFRRGATITHQNVGGTQRFALENMIELALVFLPVYFVRLGSSFMAEYMFGSIASEAHDRTMEILITSVSPLQLIIGKLLGVLAVGLTQLGTWAGFALLLSTGVGAFFEVNVLRAILGWEHLGLMVSVLLAAYVMDQVLAATLAMFRVSGGAGSMMFNTLNWVVGFGLIYAIYFVPRNPHAPLAVITSLIPVTASIVLLVRVVVTEVPLWQLTLAHLSLWGTIILSVFWLRWLLQANLVANATPFNLRAWWKKTLRRQRRAKAPLI